MKGGVATLIADTRTPAQKKLDAKKAAARTKVKSYSTSTTSQGSKSKTGKKNQSFFWKPV